MSEQHADQGHRKFFSTMKNMTWKERIEHFVYYYGKFVLIGAFLLYMAVSVLYDAYQTEPEKILSGTAINVHVSVDMEKKLTEDAFTAVGGTDTQTQEAKLVANQVSQTDLYTSVLQTKLLAGDFDYVLMDQTALDVLLSMQALPELNLILPEEKLDAWEGKFISVQTDGQTYPVALDITGTPLAAGCTYDGERIFLAFPVNMDTLDVVEPFYDYLMAQGLLTLP